MWKCILLCVCVCVHGCVRVWTQCLRICFCVWVCGWTTYRRKDLSTSVCFSVKKVNLLRGRAGTSWHIPTSVGPTFVFKQKKFISSTNDQEKLFSSMQKLLRQSVINEWHAARSNDTKLLICFIDLVGRNFFLVSPEHTAFWRLCFLKIFHLFFVSIENLNSFLDKVKFFGITFWPVLGQSISTLFHL